MSTIMIVEDEKLLRWSIKTALLKENFNVTDFETAEESLEFLNKNEIDYAVIDIRLPGIDGIKLLEKIKEIDKEIEVIIMTAFTEIELVVESIKKGAFHFIKKPFKIEELKLLINKAIEHKNMQKMLKINAISKKETSIIGKSQIMKKNVFDVISKLSSENADCTMLILGESGTGKELIAKELHKTSTRKDGPLVPINCTALNKELLESELFGHIKGSFTGAINNKKGLFELANNGTLFLDEIGEIHLDLQVKLLRAIEEKTIRKVGDIKDIKVNVRIIAATNKNLEEEVKKGNFREDLFFRLNVFPIYLPPLKDRADDKIEIANYYINYFNKEFNKKVKKLSDDAKELILNYDFPGNIRELKNIIERAMILTSNSEISKENLLVRNIAFNQNKNEDDKEIHSNFNEFSIDNLENLLNKIEISEDNSIDIQKITDIIEKIIIDKTLKKTGYNQSKTAKMLNITREILRYRMKKFNLL